MGNKLLVQLLQKVTFVQNLKNIGQHEDRRLGAFFHILGLDFAITVIWIAQFLRQFANEEFNEAISRVTPRHYSADTVALFRKRIFSWFLSQFNEG